MSGATVAVFQNQRSFGVPPGSQTYTASSHTRCTYTFVVPAGVTSISAVGVAPGAGGGYRFSGGGGALVYINNMVVTPGQSISIAVGGSPLGGSYSCGGGNVGYSTYMCCSGGTHFSANGGNSYASCQLGGTFSYGNPNGGGGGNGGNGSCHGGGGGAGGYAGKGGNSTAAGAACSGAGGGGGRGFSCGRGGGGGGGVGIFGKGTTGSYASGCNIGGNAGSSGTNGGNGASGPGPGGIGGGYGGGGGFGGVLQVCCTCVSFGSGGAGGSGAIRFVWPGNTRKFPSTCVGSP